VYKALLAIAVGLAAWVGFWKDFVNRTPQAGVDLPSSGPGQERVRREWSLRNERFQLADPQRRTGGLGSANPSTKAQPRACQRNARPNSERGFGTAAMLDIDLTSALER
jgi:hypothetical protein